MRAHAGEPVSAPRKNDVITRDKNVFKATNDLQMNRYVPCLNFFITLFYFLGHDFMGKSFKSTELFDPVVNGKIAHSCLCDFQSLCFV